MEAREFRREVTQGIEEIHFALKWTEGMLRDWLSTHAAALLTIAEPRRTLDQNAKMWPMLADVAKQVDWTVDGQLQKLEPEEWKHIFSAALRKYQRVATGIEGGFVILGQSTRRLSKSEFSDLIEIIYEFGSRHSVVWSEPAKQTYAKYGRRRVA